MFQYYINEPLYNILNEIRNNKSLYSLCQLYGILLKREGINYEINGITGIKFTFFRNNINYYLIIL